MKNAINNFIQDSALPNTRTARFKYVGRIRNINQYKKVVNYFHSKGYDVKINNSMFGNEVLVRKVK
jgi:hypothetical protein